MSITPYNVPVTSLYLPMSILFISCRECHVHVMFSLLDEHRDLTNNRLPHSATSCLGDDLYACVVFSVDSLEFVLAGWLCSLLSD